MPSVDFVKSVKIVRSARVMQLEGLFDVPRAQESEMKWRVSLPIESRSWNIGLIVGASGSGKTLTARQLFGDRIVNGFDWPENNSIVDAFPAHLSIKEITGLLSSVGFSSPPSWLRPFRVLSNGEQFRVTIARAMAESTGLFVVDEFSSVVDRTVARIGSHAIAKTIRGRKQQFIAVSCHYDIIDWLQPDWVYEPGTDSFQWRELQRHPDIRLEVQRVHSSAWDLFKRHHYLSTEINKSAACFIGFVEDRPAVFSSVLSFPHAVRPGWREHRTVCLPDFQGVGIGNAMSEYVASLFAATQKPFRSTTSHPAMIRHRTASPLWKLTHLPGLNGKISGSITGWRKAATDRLTASFEYLGAPRVDDARHFGISRAA